MSDHRESKKSRAVSINLGDSEGRIEEILALKDEPARLRFSSWQQGRLQSQSLELTEQELLNLLKVAIRVGILSPDFIKELSSEFEI